MKKIQLVFLCLFLSAASAYSSNYESQNILYIGSNSIDDSGIIQLEALGHTITQIDETGLSSGYDYSSYSVIIFGFYVFWSGDPNTTPMQEIKTLNENGGIGLVIFRSDKIRSYFDLTTIPSTGYVSGNFSITDNSHWITEPFSTGLMDLGFTYMSNASNPTANTTTLGGVSSTASLVVHNNYRRVISPYYGHTGGMPWTSEAAELTQRIIAWAAAPSVVNGNESAIVGNNDTIIYKATDEMTFVKWYKKQNEGPWIVYNTTDTFLIENYNTVSQWHYMVEYTIDSETDSTSIFTVQSKYEQTLSFDALAEMAMTDDDQTPSASANSDSSITFSSSNESIATIVNGKIHPTGVGTCTITASAEENDWYWASEEVTQEVTIKSQGQTITFTLQDTAYVGDADIIPGATATSALTVTYSSSDSSIATIVDNKVQMVAEGICTIYANQAGNGTYAAAQTAQEIAVLTHAPMITNIFPTENDRLLIDSVYITKAIIKTNDPAGIDTAIAYWGPSPESLTISTGLVQVADSFYTELSMPMTGTFYGQIVAYGENGKNDSTEVVAVTFVTSLYYQGTGAEEDPYLISTKADLIHLSLDTASWGNHFLQTADITFDPSGIEDWNGDGLIMNDSDTLGFNPIGYNSNHIFFGAYNGDHYSISNIMINADFIAKPYDEPQDEMDLPSFGLFGKCIEATLSNIVVENINIKTAQYPFAITGGLVGTAFATVIDQCMVSGMASNKESMLSVQGGLAGLAFEAEPITNSSSSVTIIAEDIMQSYYAGGFVGLFIGDYILNCFSTGAIINNNIPSALDGEVLVGGFGGMVVGALALCYSTGYIQTDALKAEGLNAFVGEIEASEFYGCYYDYTTQMTEQSNIDSELTPLAYINFKDSTSFTDWSISINGDSAWMANPIGRPYLSWQNAKVSNDTIAGNFETGFSLSGSIATDGTITEKGVISINTTTLEVDTFISSVATTDSIAIDFPAYNFGDEYIAQAYAIVDGATYYGDAVFMVRNTCLGATTTTALDATDITPSSFTAHWEAQEDASKYLVTVYDMYGDTKTIALDNTEVTDTFLVVSELVAGRTYYYTVKTVGAHDCVSDDSNTIEVTTGIVTELEKQLQLAKVRTDINTIEVITQANTTVNIYHISGIRIASEIVQSSTIFDVRSGIYLVELNNMVHKVVVP